MKTIINIYSYDALTDSFENIETTTHIKSHSKYYYKFIQYQSKCVDDTDKIVRKVVNKFYSNEIIDFDTIASFTIDIDYNTIEFDFRLKCK